MFIGNHFANIETIQKVFFEKFKNIPETDFSRSTEKLEDRLRSYTVYNGIKLITLNTILA